MGWAISSNVSTSNLNDATDSPAAARPDLKTALDELKNVIDGRNTANGVAGLNGSSKIIATQIPNEINSDTATALTLDPATGKVKIEEIINLAPQTTAQLNARTDKTAGDIAYCSDADSAAGPAIAVCDGTNWFKIDLGAQL